MLFCGLYLLLDWSPMFIFATKIITTNMKSFFFILLSFSAILFSCADSNTKAPAEEAVEVKAASGSDLVRLNQVGYYPTAKKTATVVVDSTKFASYTVVNLVTGEEVQAGELSAPKKFELSGETVQQLDFTAVQAEGQYQIKFDNGLYSHPFTVGANIYDDVLTAAVKSFYYQRVGAEVTEEHGGKWHRPAGHPDTLVHFHPSTGQEGTKSSTKGWYDAGDFGKYISNGAFATGQVLMALERYPNMFADNTLNIPESGNGINDLLDEIKYSADWIATMQDVDGGVYHKLTTEKFTDKQLPHEAQQKRFFMPKSSSSTLDFAAFLAKMARHYKAHDADLAAEWVAKAEKAWAWSKKNPSVPFKNPEGVVTGEYGDDVFHEEEFWAAAELYITTGKEEYLKFAQSNIPDLTYTYGDGWKSFMRFLGVFALLNDDVTIPADFKKALKAKLIASADDLVTRVNKFDYNQGVNDFQWASNSDVQNVAVVIAEAYRVDPKPAYKAAVLSSLDYIFGHNGVGYCFITGFGSKPPMYIHHRQSEYDDVVEPVPGFVAGGPNNHKQDKHDVDYGKDASPMHSYQDVWPSYASNEVCLNWNSPTPYLLKFAIEEGKK